MKYCEPFVRGFLTFSLIYGLIRGERLHIVHNFCYKGGKAECMARHNKVLDKQLYNMPYKLLIILKYESKL